jgi:AcrR family transcriptional regulator
MNADLSQAGPDTLPADREDCFLAAFDHALDVLADRARPAFEAEREWQAQVRAGLGALLACLDEEPALRRLVFLEALAVGPRVLERRTEVLKQLAAVIDGGRAGGLAPEGLPWLTAEGLLGAVFGVIYMRLFRHRPELVELLDSLTATIVFPYRGRAAGAREFAHTPARRRGTTSPRGAQGSHDPAQATHPSPHPALLVALEPNLGSPGPREGTHPRPSTTSFDAGSNLSFPEILRSAEAPLKQSNHKRSS